MLLERNLTEYKLILDAEPKPLSRHRGFLRGGHISFYNPSAVEQKKAQLLLKKEIGKSKVPFFAVEAVEIDFIFFYKRKKSQKTEHKTTKPDLDNLVKFYLDAMNAVCFADDKQVVRISATKQFWNRSCVVITMRAL